MQRFVNDYSKEMENSSKNHSTLNQKYVAQQMSTTR